MTKFSKIIIFTAIIIAFIVGGVVGKFVFGSNQPTKDSNNNASNNASTLAKTDKLTSILAKPLSYIGDTVVVEGSIYKIDNDYYLIEHTEDTSKEQSNSIKLDLSKSKIDISKYAMDGSTKNTTIQTGPPKPDTIKPGAVITGKISNNESGNQFVLIVSSIETAKADK
ncbi:MAG: hypothetical protein ABI220_04930 [Candidatus Saccharimonadales bacterium]